MLGFTDFELKWYGEMLEAVLNAVDGREPSDGNTFMGTVHYLASRGLTVTIKDDKVTVAR